MSAVTVHNQVAASQGPRVAFCSAGEAATTAQATTTAGGGAGGASKQGGSQLKSEKIIIYQYKICPFCNKLKVVMDYFGIPHHVTEVRHSRCQPSLLSTRTRNRIQVYRFCHLSVQVWNRCVFVVNIISILVLARQLYAGSTVVVSCVRTTRTSCPSVAEALESLSTKARLELGRSFLGPQVEHGIVAFDKTDKKLVILLVKKFPLDFTMFYYITVDKWARVAK